MAKAAEWLRQKEGNGGSAARWYGGRTAAAAEYRNGRLNGDIWVCRRQLGTDGGSGEGWRSKAGGEGLLYFLGRAMFWGSKVRRRGVFSKHFLLSNLTAENTKGHSVLTEHKNL